MLLTAIASTAFASAAAISIHVVPARYRVRERSTPEAGNIVFTPSDAGARATTGRVATPVAG
jgi:hypothetical protein